VIDYATCFREREGAYMKIRVTTDIDLDGSSTNEVKLVEGIEPRGGGDEVIIMDNGGSGFTAATAADRLDFIVNKNRFGGLAGPAHRHPFGAKKIVIAGLMIEGEDKAIPDDDNLLQSFVIKAGGKLFSGSWLVETVLFEFAASEKTSSWHSGMRPGYGLVVTGPINYIQVLSTKGTEYGPGTHSETKKAGLRLEIA
jgi:hypothetical protein